MTLKSSRNFNKEKKKKQLNPTKKKCLEVDCFEYYRCNAV